MSHLRSHFAKEVLQAQIDFLPYHLENMHTFFLTFRNLLPIRKIIYSVTIVFSVLFPTPLDFTPAFYRMQFTPKKQTTSISLLFPISRGCVCVCTHTDVRKG